MPAYDLEPQVVMTTPLLEGLDGVEKMSKSLGNYVGVTESPAEMFGKLMSISDELMWKYYTLLTDLPQPEIAAKQAAVAAGTLHPKQAKIELAKSIVADYHGADAAAAAAEAFERRFAKKEVPADIVERPMLAGTLIEHLLLETGFAQSGSDATRKIQQGAVRIDGEKFTSTRAPVDRLEPFILQVGRRMARIVVVTPTDLVVSAIPGEADETWLIMQNKGNVDVPHASRESAVARARDIAQALHARVFVMDGDRMVEATEPSST
jgi:tyrosyl-tRNA synthetase